MASVTDSPKPQPPTGSQAPRGQEPLVDRQIRRTRRALKIVDTTAGLITLLIGVLGFLLTVAVFEHWVIPGGWSPGARTTLFGALLLGIAWYSWRTFWPIVRQSINPAFAAQAIEQSSPSLKNSLLNLLLLRSHKRRLSRQVYQEIEQQAAQRLSQVPIESVIDRSAIVRLGYILLALTAICVLYRFLSPKDPIASVGRVLLPWSEISTPSRVEILHVTPGDTQVARGEQLEVTAEVLGLEEEEPVRLFYSTADEQIVRQEIPMTASAGGSLFSCQVPGRVGGRQRGVEQNFIYWIEAGDARSPEYQVGVFARPTMVVSKLRYEFPAYTSYPSRTVEHTGDVRAVEGTKVTLFAQANKPIKTAHIDFEADGRRDLLMNATGQEATVTFPLALRDDRRTPRYQSYALRYVTDQGKQNEQPPKYKIEVLPDYSPEIQLLLPEEAVLEVPLNQEVNFELEARDPDFALSEVLLVGQLGEEQVMQEVLLERNHTGRFVGKLRKTPAEIGLKSGDVMEYWSVAADNRWPDANLAYSAHRKLRVTDSWQGNENGEQNPEDQQQQPGEQDDSGEGEGGDGQEGPAGGGDQGKASEQEQDGEGQGGPGQQGDESGENKGQQQSQGGNGENGDNQDEGNDSQGGGNSSSENSDSENSDSGDSSINENDDNSNEGGDGEAGGDQEKVSPNGDDDGSAFEKIAKHFEEQEGGNEGQNGESSEGEQSGEPSEGANRQSDNSSQGKPGAKQDRQSPNEGAQGDPAATEEKQEDGQQQPQDGESPDGQISQEQGDAGAGNNNGQEQGNPNSSNSKRPEEKEGGDSSSDQRQENSEAPLESSDQKESNTESGQGGDRTGDGQEGAGQQADQKGKGAAGQNEAADDGAGKASEQGDGETGDNPGDQQKADGKTGQSSGNQKGDGSKQSEQKGDQPEGKEQGDSNSQGKPDGGNQQGPQGEQGLQDQQGQEGNKAAEQGDQNKQQQQPSGDQQSQENNDPSNSAQPQSGDPSGTGGQAGNPPPDGETLPGDDANLDYARKQTDLILDKLDEQLQKKKVDQDLLEKLGWTQDELRQFVDRWKNLKAEANNPDAAEATTELNDALRSLGLNRNRSTKFRSKTAQDKLRDLREGFRGKVPLEYQEQVRSYLKGTSKALENRSTNKPSSNKQ